MVLIEREDGLQIRRISSDDEIEEWRGAFIGAYQTVFSGPPYRERFSPSDAGGVYRRLTRTRGHITLLAVNPKHMVVGFGVAIPLGAKSSVSRELTGLVTLEDTMYLAELGVLPQHRGSGLGRTLVQARLALIDNSRYQNVCLRVAAERNASYNMYVGMGFTDMGVYMEVSAPRTNGTVRTDRRLFLHARLSSLDLGDCASLVSS